MLRAALRGEEFGRGGGLGGGRGNRRGDGDVGCPAPVVRQQLREVAVLERGQPLEHVLEVGPGVVAVEFGRLRRSPNYAEWARLLR